MRFYFHIGGGPRRPSRQGMYHHDHVRRHRMEPGVHVHTNGTGNPIVGLILFIIIAAIIGFVFFKMF